MPRAIIEMKLPARIRKKGKLYLSSCDVLDIHTRGYSEEEARRNLAEVIKLFFISCYERGTLDEALQECGFRALKARARPVKGGDFVTVPISFATKNHCLRECRV